MLANNNNASPNDVLKQILAFVEEEESANSNEEKDPDWNIASTSDNFDKIKKKRGRPKIHDSPKQSPIKESKDRVKESKKKYIISKPRSNFIFSTCNFFRRARVWL